MSAFSEYFMMIKNRRNLTGAQIAEMCDKETSMVFHWLSGTRYPNEWKLMEDVVEKLKLSGDEYQKLKDAYKRTVLGESDYTCHKKIMEIFQLLKERRDEYAGLQEEKNMDVRDVRLPEFIKLNGKMEILVWLQRSLDYLSMQRKRNVLLNFQNSHQEVILLLKMFCSKIKDCKLEEIVYLCREENVSNALNLEVLKDIIEMLVQKNTIDIYYLEELDYEKGFAENWIISDDFLILYDAELTNGMLTTNREWIDNYKDSFEKLKKISDGLGRKECGALEYKKEQELRECTCYSMEYMPFFWHCLTEEVLEKHIYKEVSNRANLIQSISQNNLKKNKNSEFLWNSFFSRKGYIEFMETGRIEKFPYTIYQKPTLQTRCEIMQMCIDSAKEGRLNYFMIKEGELPEMQNLYIEQVWGNQKKLFINMFLEEGVYERFEIKDGGLQQQFLIFFEYLEKYGYIYNAEETLSYMEQMLEEYKKRL